ncbi:MAG: hypothetical protein Q9160_009168 [Pyrenula sp. 1 TL-2023]
MAQPLPDRSPASYGAAAKPRRLQKALHRYLIIGRASWQDRRSPPGRQELHRKETAKGTVRLLAPFRRATPGEGAQPALQPSCGAEQAAQAAQSNISLGVDQAAVPMVERDPDPEDIGIPRDGFYEIDSVIQVRSYMTQELKCRKSSRIKKFNEKKWEDAMRVVYLEQFLDD